MPPGPASTTPLAIAPTSTSAPPTSPQVAPTLTPGAIAGIAIGAVVLFALVAVLVWFLLRQRRKLQLLKAAQDQKPRPEDASDEIIAMELAVPVSKHELGSLRVDVDGGSHELRPELLGSPREELAGRPISELPSPMTPFTPLTPGTQR